MPTIALPLRHYTHNLCRRWPPCQPLSQLSRCCCFHSTLCTQPAPPKTDSVYTHSNRVPQYPPAPSCCPFSMQQSRAVGAVRAGGAVVFLVYFCACFYSLRGTRKMGSADWKRAAADVAVVAFIAALRVRSSLAR